MMLCEKTLLGICLEKPSHGLDSSIFGFAEFLVALALLVIVYTISDVRYRFRVAIAPTPLYNLTYYLIGIIGFGTLLTDIWVAEGWLVPQSYITLPIWQGMFGVLFLSLAMTWMYYAFINPPIFSVKNYQKFAHKLYRIILKGADDDLSIIGSELQMSAESLIKHSNLIPSELPSEAKKEEMNTKHVPNIGDYAYDILLLIGNRKLCRNIVKSSPITAIEFFDAMANSEKYSLPIGQFARNISTEAIINKDSILYHEDEGYLSGLIGYLKPFSQAIYGNYKIVESIGYFNSPLDIDQKIVWSWDASQLEAYSRAAQITFKSYLHSGNWMRSQALERSLLIMEQSCRDVYKLNNMSSEYYSTDIYERLERVVGFACELINLIDKQEKIPQTKLRLRKERQRRDFFDRIAKLMFAIIASAASVKSPPDTCWAIHYVAVWSNFFNLSRGGKVWDIILFKLRRLLYDEILRLEKHPNYRSSRILGLCLNVMGLELGDEMTFGRQYYALHKAILNWTRNNYMRLRDIHSDVADSCLIGSISFDEHSARLVKTYAKGLNLEAPKEYLELRPSE